MWNDVIYAKWRQMYSTKSYHKYNCPCFDDFGCIVAVGKNRYEIGCILHVMSIYIWGSYLSSITVASLWCLFKWTIISFDVWHQTVRLACFRKSLSLSLSRFRTLFLSFFSFILSKFIQDLLHNSLGYLVIHTGKLIIIFDGFFQSIDCECIEVLNDITDYRLFLLSHFICPID